MPNNLIKNYMRSPISSIDSGETIQDAAQFMMSKGVRSLLVRENEDFIGIVSKTDFILKVYVNENMDPERDIVLDIMSKPVLSLGSNATMEEARNYMQEKKIGHLGVKEDSKIVGILSKKDLLVFFGKLI